MLSPVQIAKASLCKVGIRMKREQKLTRLTVRKWSNLVADKHTFPCAAIKVTVLLFVNAHCLVFKYFNSTQGQSQTFMFLNHLWNVCAVCPLFIVCLCVRMCVLCVCVCACVCVCLCTYVCLCVCVHCVCICACMCVCACVCVCTCVSVFIVSVCDLLVQLILSGAHRPLGGCVPWAVMSVSWFCAGIPWAPSILQSGQFFPQPEIPNPCVSCKFRFHP